MMNLDFWKNKRVFITGHTGFKGTWLCLFLSYMGAKVTGYALKAPTNPSLFEITKAEELIEASIEGDIRNLKYLQQSMQKANPEIVIHMAAQPLVRESYKIPVETYETNVMGTVHVMEAIRHCQNVKAVVNVTTDKCYENKEWAWGYRENEAIGGYDPYSSSKGCSELVTAAYRSSFFSAETYKKHGIAIATARAGNVIGGGDWANDRLIPDLIRAILAGEDIMLRNPQAIRPWQHVLEPLYGYLTLSQHLYEKGMMFAEGWNFGPHDNDAKSVSWIVNELCRLWGSGVKCNLHCGDQLHEATYLKLDCSKAKARLNWEPVWNLKQALEKIYEWVSAYQKNNNMRELCYQQIAEYIEQVEKK